MNILKNFLLISTWKSVIVILFFYLVLIGQWLFLKKFKNKIYILLSGLFLGLFFGLIIQLIVGFPNNFYNPVYPNKNVELYWVYELSLWAQIIKKIFISSIILIMVPIVFLSIFRSLSKPSSKRVGLISIKGILFMLLNVIIAFFISFGIGWILKIGITSNGKVLDLFIGQSDTFNQKINSSITSLPELVINYLPNNIIATFGGTAVIPLVILATIFGIAVKYISKNNYEKIEPIIKLADALWEIIIKIVQGLTKIIPLAITSIVTSLMVTESITSLISVAKVLIAGYISLLLCVIYLLIMILCSKLSIKNFWKFSKKPFIQGMLTQSSSAALPYTMSSLTDDLKINDSSVSTILPLSTTIGMIGGAGCEGGLIVALLWTGSSSPLIHGNGVLIFLFLACLMTSIISLGIPGTAGTSTLVITGLTGALGIPIFTNAILSIMLTIEDIFDIGRTGVNILAASTVSILVAKSEGMIKKDSVLLKPHSIYKQNKILKIYELKNLETNKINNLKEEYDEKYLLNNELGNIEKNKYRDELSQKIKLEKINFKKEKKEFLKWYQSNKIHEIEKIKNQYFKNVINL